MQSDQTNEQTDRQPERGAAEDASGVPMTPTEEEVSRRPPSQPPADEEQRRRQQGSGA